MLLCPAVVSDIDEQNSRTAAKNSAAHCARSRDTSHAAQQSRAPAHSNFRSEHTSTVENIPELSVES